MGNMLEMFPECRPATRRKLSYKRAYSLQYALLSDRVISLFDWKGLPFAQRELEVKMQLTGQGYTGIVWSKDLAKWLVAHGSGVGVTEYPDEWINYTWACPLASGINTIGKNVTICRNNSLLISSRFIVEQYAHLMAHSLLSLQAVLINSRATGFTTASNDEAFENAKAFYEALEDGRTEVIKLSEDLETAEGSKPFDFISEKLSGEGSKALDYWQLYQNIYKDFLEFIGVSKSTDKRERLIVQEVEQDLPLYRFNIEDMLDCRREAAEEFSRISGLSVSVDLAESVKRAQELPGREDINESENNL